MLAQYPQSTSVRNSQTSGGSLVLWGTAVLGLLLGGLLTWLLPQAAGLGTIGLWLLGMAIAAISGGLLTVRRGVNAQWGLLFLGQFLGVTAVFLLLVAG